MYSKVALLSILALGARAEKFQFNYDEPVPYVENQLGQRFMQVTQPDCKPAGSLFVCENVGTTVSDSQGKEIAITARLVCNFSPLTQVDFRQAQGCGCEAQVATADGGSKECACTLCPAGYGDNPISIDCDMGNTTGINTTDAGAVAAVDPYILDSCTSFDCDFRCNGTCKFGCDEVPLPEECFGLCGTPEPTAGPAAVQTTSRANAMVVYTLGGLIVGSLFMAINV